MIRNLLPALLILAACPVALAQDKTPAVQDHAAGRLNPFPGGVGSYWIYKGETTQAPGVDYAKAQEKKVRWRMSLERILHRDGATAFIVNGFPDDLDWSDDPKPKLSMFVLTDDGGLYRFNGEEETSEQKFNDPQVTLKQLLEDAEPWFQWPPVVGAQPGGGTCPDRTDQMYCWTLDPPEKLSLRKVKGAPSGQHTGYSLAYRTNPDDAEVEIVSGVGVTGYWYHHHGTISEVDLYLLEVHLTEQK